MKRRVTEITEVNKIEINMLFLLKFDQLVHDSLLVTRIKLAPPFEIIPTITGPKGKIELKV